MPCSEKEVVVESSDSEEYDKMGTMEMGAGVGGGDCEKIYREANNSVQQSFACNGYWFEGK
jgi:hypothetical protein